MSEIAARLGIVQRVLPVYRAAFFETLAAACQRGLGVFAGEPRADEAIESAPSLSKAQLTTARNHHLLRGKFYLLWQAGLRAWLENWQPEVVVLEANPRYLSSPAAVRWMRRRRRPVIGWGLGAPASGGLRAAMRRAFLAQFDALVTYSAQGASEYCALGFPAGKIFVAPNAAAPRPTHPIPERSPLLSPAQVTVLFVGRLQARKRVDYLLRACAAQPEQQRPHLWIVGDGPARPGLEELARAVYPQAEFLGARHGPDLEHFFSAADLFVLPGTGGLAVQQAMSFGLPVMVAEADGTQADLVRPENGWMLPPGDLDALVRQLRDALADVPRLRVMGRESYRITRDEINLEKMVSVFAEAVRAVQ